jgi:hypothetical protein
MFQPAKAKVSCNSISASVTCEQAISVSPSTHQLCLYSHSHTLQTRLASRIATSSGKVTPRGVLRARPRLYIGTYLCYEMEIRTSI